MSKGFKILRIEYIFTVIVPCLVAIYLNGYDLIDHLEIIAAFGFWAICGNTLNDFFDMQDPNDKETLERVEGFRRKEIGAISGTAFIIGCVLFMRPIFQNWIIAIYLAIIVISVVLYCAVLKPYVVINWIVLGVSHIWLPYFIIKINAGDAINGWPKLEIYEVFLLICASSMALSGNLIHEIIDKEAITNYSLKSQQIIVWITSICALILGLISLVLFFKYAVYFTPFVLFPLETMYMARSQEKVKSKQGKTSLKDTGIICGNLFFVFMIILVIVHPI
ncbi:MAG: UbiA family prenyltransferase [Promethearchaeota archaeon]